MNVHRPTSRPAPSPFRGRLRSIRRAIFIGLSLAASPSVLITPATAAAEAINEAALFRSGRYAECVDAAAKAMDTEHFNEAHRIWKLRAELELGRYPDAVQTLETALKRFPTSVELRFWGLDACRYDNQPQRRKQLEDEILQLMRQAPGRYYDAGSRILLGRFLLGKGAEPKQVLDGLYSPIKKQQPNFAPAFLASGDLALEKQDFALAAQAFEQALKIDDADPEAHFGLARAFAPSEPGKSQESLRAALERNSNHIGSLLLLAEDQIDRERYDEAEQVLRQVATINPHHPRAAAYRAVLAHLKNQPEDEKRHHEEGLRFWPTNPDVDHVIGKKLSQKYRFAEGAAYQRAALALDAKYLPASLQLAQDLLRLGQESDGLRLAEDVYRTDAYSVVAHNLVELQENLAKFRTLEVEGFLVRMDPREAEIYGARVLDLLKRAKEVLCPKYDVTIDGPIIVEMFPRQEDFAIRTFGLPGGAGFLGVCFGNVITANSPASQAAHPTCWEATLWHEFCHVVTLNKTRNKMPRWLSEGISVYEERQADPTWGQSINPRYREMLLKDDLTPVSRLSGAFLTPPTPLHLQFTYFESSLVVEYLVETQGVDALKRILVDLGTGITINDALSRHAGSLEALDAGFTEFARKRAQQMAPEADWSEPELPRRADAEMLSGWLKEHPRNYMALQRLAKQRVANKEWAGAKETLVTLRQLYPQDAGSDSVYVLLARVHRELNEGAEERASLEKLAELSPDNTDVFARLTELAAQAGDWEHVRKLASRWLAVNPLQPAPHRVAAEAAERLHDDPLAIESYRALLLLEPLDPSELHLRLATALHRTGDLVAAKREALWALEETPRFRAAQRTLLEIVSEIEKQQAPVAPAEPVSTDAPAKKGL